MGDVGIYLLKGAWIEQAVDPLAGRELALGALSFDRFASPTLARYLPAPEGILIQVMPVHLLLPEPTKPPPVTRRQVAITNGSIPLLCQTVQCISPPMVLPTPLFSLRHLSLETFSSIMRVFKARGRTYFEPFCDI
jgi:hypothetical protein